MAKSAQQIQGETEPIKPVTAAARGVPDPSITLIEFGDGIGVLLAARTERDNEHKRVVLKKVAYIRLTPEGWGATALPEAWVGKGEDGIYRAMDAANGKLFRWPTRRLYEFAFISAEIFETAIQCMKDKNPVALYELVAVTFGTHKDFSVEEGALVGPDDYSSDPNLASPDLLLPFPPVIKAAEKA